MHKMTKIITKTQVIKALKTNKLRRGHWFHYIRYKIPNNCKVCAVGAVLREVSFVTWANKYKINGSGLGNRAMNFKSASSFYVNGIYEKNIVDLLKKKIT